MTNQNEKLMSTLGEYLRQIRVINGLTQEELANKMNVHRNTISFGENGGNLTIKILLEYSDQFDMSLSEIFRILD